MLRQFLITRRILRDAFGHFNETDGWALASHVALSTLLAIFPFLIFATTLATFLGADRFAEVAVHLVFDTWPERIAAPIAREVESVLTVQRGGLLTISVIVAAVFASNGIEALRVALNRAYRVTETRSFTFMRLQSLLFVVIATIGFMAISFLLVLAPLAYRLAEQWVPGMETVSFSIGFWRYVVALSVLITGLFVVHKWLPDGKRSLGSLVPGIALTILAWLIGAGVFAAYLERFATYVTTYAGLASIMIALVFLYIISAIFILGAEINAAILRYRAARAIVVPARGNAADQPAE
ncbi:MAG: YihY/virulence factor BrkB family protein [Roseitalea sp.]|jgi:membrane protein|uniref:YihY/virulence factor BrkB family protein n=1 Tax=Oceaniradius stylonematis TaxID=2184161 RepID=A0A3A8ANY8_9HYPH|nr:YihY/virulence factor BrkB family protein [Oceaniradius stylonematis]MBO6554481.1 YihY/virulence factor BrkB family protein [Roseitalea sp.]MBO6953358.1 YihY/virulence factor BrkB family protein [Rhizobiaceae bacterium]MBO6593873.1 YihY/virulence factor BrkB family protein [Roseitalea sp.]MBO6601102.1 YihY/virulence factor BrkB family protein [Roseitalea sp.]MBO6613834.1 YihY/virulence factor BrkB family protein [Roseitalea sp.]